MSNLISFIIGYVTGTAVLLLAMALVFFDDDDHDKI